MERYDLLKYGPHMDKPRGFIANVGKGEYAHRFGGSGQWSGPCVADSGPMLLLTLDLEDPWLACLRSSDERELPLCADLNYDSMAKQTYSIDPKTGQVELIEQTIIGSGRLLEPQDRFPNPLPEKPLYLRRMRPSEYPIDEQSYWTCCDEFLGGASTIRILGQPLWLQWVEELSCRCGRAMMHVASIGYEVDNNQRQLLDEAPFFPGEFGMYFFLCKACSEYVVSWQDS